MLPFKTFTASEIETFYDYHDELNPVLWENWKLKPDVERKLSKIADVFAEYSRIPTNSIFDIIITGSCANFNWTMYSDIDLHIVYDKQFLVSRFPSEDIFDEFIQNKRRLFNERHKITIKGFEVEFYPQDIHEAQYGLGLYSIKKRKWLKLPRHKKPNINDSAVKNKVAELMNEIAQESEGDCPNVEKAREIVQKLLKMRKAGLQKGGEYSIENLAFKTLRGNGSIGKLIGCIQTGVDKEYSIY